MYLLGQQNPQDKSYFKGDGNIGKVISYNSVNTSVLRLSITYNC